MGNFTHDILSIFLLSCLIIHASSFQPNNRRAPNPPPNSRQPPPGGPPGGPPPQSIRRQGLPHEGNNPSQQPPINHRRIHGPPPPPKHRGRPPFPFPRRRPPPPPRNRGPPPRDGDRERRPPPPHQNHKYETPPKLSFHVPPAPVTTQPPPPEEHDHRTPQESYIQQLNNFQNPTPQQPQQSSNPPHNIQLHIQQFGSQNPSQPTNPFNNNNPNLPPQQFPSPQPNQFQNPIQFGAQQPQFGGAQSPQPNLFGGSPSPQPNLFGGSPSPQPNMFQGSPSPPPNQFGGSPSPPPHQFGGPQSPPPNQFGGPQSPAPPQFQGSPPPPPQFNPQANNQQNQNGNQFNQFPPQQAQNHQNGNEFAPPNQQNQFNQQFNGNMNQAQFPQQNPQQQEPQFQPPPPPPQYPQNQQNFQNPPQQFNEPATFGQVNPSAQPPSSHSPPILEYAPPPNTFSRANPENDAKSKEQDNLNAIPKQTITFTVTPKPSKHGGTQLHFKISTPKPFKSTLKPVTNSKGYFKGSTYRPPVDKLNTKFKYPNYPETEYRVHDGEQRESIMSAEMEPPPRSQPESIKDVLMNNRHDLNSPSRPHPDDVDEYSGPNYAASSAQRFSNQMPNENILIAGVNAGKKHVQERFDDYDNLQDGPRFDEDMGPKYVDRHLPYKDHDFRKESRGSYELHAHEYTPHHASQSIEEPFETFDRVKGNKHAHTHNPSIHIHEESLPGSGEKHHHKFSQPDPLYHPEDDRSSSKEVDDFETPPNRYESFAGDFSGSGEKKHRGKVSEKHSEESRKKSTAEELLAALGLSTNPLVSMPNSDYPIDIPTKYSVSSWEKKFGSSSGERVDLENKRKHHGGSGGEPMGLLEYLNQKNENENRATEPLYSLPDRQIGGSAENSFVVKGSMKASSKGDPPKAPPQNNVIVGRPIPQFEGTEPRIHTHPHVHEHTTGQESYIFEKLHNQNPEQNTPVPIINTGLYGPSVPPPFTDPGTFTNSPPVISTPPPSIQHSGSSLQQKPSSPGQESYLYQKIHGETLAFGPTPPSPHSVEEPNQGLYGAPLPHMQTGLYASGSEQIAAASAAAPSSGLVYSNGKINAPGGVLLPYGMNNAAQSRVSEPTLYNPNSGANQPVPQGIQTLYPQSPQAPQYAPPLPPPQQTAPPPNPAQTQHLHFQTPQHQLPASPPNPQPQAPQQHQQPNPLAQQLPQPNQPQQHHQPNPLAQPNQPPQQQPNPQQQQQQHFQQYQQSQQGQLYQQASNPVPSSPVLPPQQQQAPHHFQQQQLQHQASQLHPQVQQPAQQQNAYGNNPNEPIDRIAGIPNFSSEQISHPQNIHQQQLHNQQTQQVQQQIQQQQQAQHQAQQQAQSLNYGSQMLSYQNAHQNVFQAYADAQNAASNGQMQSVTPRYGAPYPVPVYVTEPDPIIEIIVQDSNMTLPALPTYAPPPTQPPTPEPVHVFYVKYSQNNNSLDNYYAGSAPHVQLEQPISSIPVRGPDRNGMLPVEDNTQPQPQIQANDNMQSASIQQEATQSPPTTTTLRTIIRPDRNEFQHPNSNQQGGLVVSFDNPAIEEQIFANYTNDNSQNYAQQIQQLQAQAQAHLQAHQQAQAEAQAHAIEQSQAQSQQQVQFSPDSYYVNDQASYPGFNKRLGLQELASLLESTPQDKLENQQNQENGQNNPPPLYQYVENNNNNQNQNSKQHNLPEDVPEELRNQLVQSGILGNADVQVINYSENLFKELGELPPEALAAYQAHTTSEHPNPSDQLWSGSQVNLGATHLSDLLPQSRSIRSVLVIKNSLRPKRGGRQRRVVLLITDKNDVLLYRPKDKSIRRIGDTSNPVISRAINHTHHRMEKV